MRSDAGVGSGKIVGAPTFSKWNADNGDGDPRHIPVAQAFRPEAFSRGGMVAPGMNTLTAKRGELQNLRNIAVGENVGAPTFSDLRSCVPIGVLWSARDCSRIYGVNRKCQVSVIEQSFQSQKRWQAGALQNVGALTFAGLAGTSLRPIHVPRAFRPEAFSRGGSVARGTKPRTPQRSELPNLGIARNVGFRKIVGAPTILASLAAVRP
jgi:hypothetical protein